MLYENEPQRSYRKKSVMPVGKRTQAISHRLLSRPNVVAGPKRTVSNVESGSFFSKLFTSPELSVDDLLDTPDERPPEDGGALPVHPFCGFV